MKTTKTECIHYWIIEPPDSPESKGQCKKCGAISTFQNHAYTLSKWPGYSKPLALKGDKQSA